MTACMICQEKDHDVLSQRHSPNIPSKARIMTITVAQKAGTVTALHVIKMAVSVEPHEARVNGRPTQLNDTI